MEQVGIQVARQTMRWPQPDSGDRHPIRLTGEDRRQADLVQGHREGTSRCAEGKPVTFMPKPLFG